MADARAATTQHPEVVEVDDDQAGDGDSNYASDLSSYTASLTSSVLHYRTENGRSYHAYRDGRYLLPNDEAEADRLDLMHEMSLTIMDRKLHLAPLDPSIQRALDIGTGTGIWAIDFADQYPSAEVIGNDLSPTQPAMVPPNLKFQVDDIEDEWTYAPDSFDFVHARYLATGIKDFPRLMKQCYKAIRPGGWVEFQDWDLDLTSDDGTSKGTMIEKYFQEVLNGFGELGYNTGPGRFLKGWVEDAGFVDVDVRQYRVPIGLWPKDRHYKTIGAWSLLAAEQGLEAGAMAVLTRHHKWSPIEVQVLVAKAREDLRNPKVHSMLNYYAVYGRKPHST